MQDKISKKIAGIISLAVVVTIFLLGCGGGGGGSSTGVSPEELEVQAVIDSFSASVRDKNLTAIMSNFDTNLKYYPTDPAIPGGHEDYNQFRTRLSNFLNNTNLTGFSISNSGITMGVETSAMARATLSCEYIDQGGITKQINEQIEIKFERVSKWGITEIYAYSSSSGQSGMQFPPKP